MKNIADRVKVMVSNMSVEVSSQKNIMDKKNEIKHQQRTIIEKYQLLGEKLFSYFKSGADVGETFNDECNEIQELFDKMDNLESQITSIMKEKDEIKKKNELKTAVIPKPQVETTTNNNNTEIDGETKSKFFCHNCGCELVETAKFCNSCGTKIQ